MSMLGLDIGTTGVKAVAFREDGTAIASAYREYNLLSPQSGHLELDPNEVLEAIRTVTRAVGEETRDDPVRSVATSTLGEAAVPVDKNCQPVGNAIVGFDSRGEQEMLAFKERISNQEVFDITGHGINSYHTLFKILWRREHDPDTFRRTHKVLCFGDFLTAQLGLEPRMDYSMGARTLVLDIHRGEWSDRILEAAALTPEILPRPIAPGDPIGELGKLAADFGLPTGTVVGGGLHDQPAGILGAGIRPRESMLATGTVICLGVRLSAKPQGTVMAENNLCYYPTVGEGQYISIAWNFTGGSLLKWYRDQLAGPELAVAAKRDVDPYEIITADLPPAPTSVLVLPHFTTTGTPWLDPHALGAIFGLRLTTSRKELVKGILEGILYEIRLNSELLNDSGVAIDIYKAIGGAAKSEAWMQIAADILGRPVAITTVTEGAALGAALLGAHASGQISSSAEIDAIVDRAAHVSRVLEPDATRAKQYDERFAVYRNLYPQTRELSHRIFDLEDANGT